ncbi:MAG: hypothetical protein ABJA10_10050 [Aestuariivirga sp.]
MSFKTTIAVAAIAATAALSAATAAHADPSVGVSIGFGFADFGSGPRHFRGPDPFFDGRFHRPHRQFGWAPDYPAPVMSYGLSCSSAGNVVRAAGFRGVQATDCSRPVYGYEAWKRGELFRVNVSVAGRIVAVEPIY